MNNINELNIDLLDFQLTKIQLQNLLVFLRRTSLTGEEVPQYVELLNILTNLNNRKEGD